MPFTFNLFQTAPTQCNIPANQCATVPGNRVVLQQSLREFGINVPDTVIREWEKEQSVELVNQRLCEMLLAVREISTKLQALVSTQLFNPLGSGCNTYSTVSPSLTNPALMFQDIFGSSVQVINEPSALTSGTSMQASHGATINDPGQVNIPNTGVSGLGFRNCFYNIFVHELSHLLDYRLTMMYSSHIPIVYQRIMVQEVLQV